MNRDMIAGLLVGIIIGLISGFFLTALAWSISTKEIVEEGYLECMNGRSYTVTEIKEGKDD